jgi:hypothetical protein
MENHTPFPMAQGIHTEKISLRTLKIMSRNLNESVSSMILRIHERLHRSDISKRLLTYSKIISENFLFMSFVISQFSSVFMVMVGNRRDFFYIIS